MSSLAGRVRTAILDHDLLPAGTAVVAAVSGGADSVALLHILAGLAPGMGFDLAVAHLDHRLRGERSERDAAFVEALAARLALPFVAGRADVRARARRNGISLEMAAREARYAFLGRVCRETGATHVATGHTADDQAETVLLKLLRGAGMTGLSGMPCKVRRRSVTVVRPLMDVTRSQIVDYLQRRRLAWVEDETNRSPAFLRNRVRHEVLPLLAHRLNPQVREILRRTADVLRADSAWLDELASGILEECVAVEGTKGESKPVLDVGRLQRYPLAAQRRVLRHWLQRCGVPVEEVGYAAVLRLESLIRATRGTRSVPLAAGWAVHREYAHLVVARGAESAPAYRLNVPLPGEIVVEPYGLRITAAIDRGVTPRERGKPGALPTETLLSRRAVGRRKLVVRSWRPGDRIRLPGVEGRRKLQDVFVDTKTPRRRRSSLPVLECGREIVWLPGYRVAEGWQVHDPAGPAWHLAIEAL